jgi:hypothetical protein
MGQNETKAIRATCGRDERVIGGGFELGNWKNMSRLVRSERSREDELSWESGAKFSLSGASSLKGWAVCVDRGALEATLYLEATDTSTSSNKRAVANTQSCSQGTYLLSGGAGVADSAYDDSPNRRIRWWSNSSPPTKGAQSWKASAVAESEGLPLKVHAFALCGRFAEGGGSGDGGRADSPDKPGEPEN